VPAKDRKEKPSQAEHGKLKAMLQKHGAAAGQVSAAVGANVGNQSREDISKRLVAFLRGRPRRAG
jgi:hypothetical protein